MNDLHKEKGLASRVLLERDAILQNARWYWFFRRTQDILLSVAALMVLWPAMFIIAIVIVLDSPGAGPIFVQNRVGRDGKTFKCYKFRSMCPHAEDKLEELLPYNEMDGPALKWKMILELHGQVRY